MIVTVHQLREAVESLRGCADADTVELSLPGGRTLVGVCIREHPVVGELETPSTVSFSLPPFPGPAED